MEGDGFSAQGTGHIHQHEALRLEATDESLNSELFLHLFTEIDVTFI